MGRAHDSTGGGRHDGRGTKKGAPGFTAVFVIAGVLAVAYAMMRRRR